MNREFESIVLGRLGVLEAVAAQCMTVVSQIRTDKVGFISEAERFILDRVERLPVEARPHALDSIDRIFSSVRSSIE